MQKNQWLKGAMCLSTIKITDMVIAPIAIALPVNVEERLM